MPGFARLGGQPGHVTCFDEFQTCRSAPAPYIRLQGIIGLGALLTATVVLAKQNRLARLAEQRAHLDLKVTLLTEQKAAKLIDPLEELRRDLPNVRNRHDPEAVAPQQSMNPGLVLAALDERSEPDAGLKPRRRSRRGRRRHRMTGALRENWLLMSPGFQDRRNLPHGLTAPA